MQKKAIIILAEGFEEIETTTPIDLLRRSGIDVTVCGLVSNEIKGSRGMVIKADRIIDDIDEDYDACILPGGMPGASNLAESGKVSKLIKNMHKDDKIIAALCASPAVVLAPTGILDNKSATCYPGMENGFHKTTTPKEDDVVVDGNIITSRGPATAFSFSLKIIEMLCGKDTANLVQRATLFTHQSQQKTS